MQSGVNTSVLGKNKTFSQGRPTAAESSVFGRSQPSQIHPQSQQSFSQGMSMSQISQNSLEDVLANEQGFNSQDRGNSAKKVSCLAPITYPQESQLQVSRSSNNVIRKWNSNSVAESRCPVSEELERRIGLMETSVNRMGIILDSVESDVIQINKAVKEVSMETEGIRQKMTAHDNAMQMMMKGDEEIKANLDASLKAIPNQLRKGFDHQKLQEISSEISKLPNMIDARLLRFKAELNNIFTKELRVVVNSIKLPIDSQPAPTIQPPEEKLRFNHIQAVSDIGNEQAIQVIIDSDEEFDGAFSCLLDEKKPRRGVYLADDVEKETLQILRKARRRKRKRDDIIILSE
ncbi:Protein PAIR1 [Acorus calamus]|uniref:Protein PAIR1 n=1 Tax=Acorus calamus TaxID=4465 RepID=A0AAV9CR91_ACOCL|nr:Protein PAIR1 [Acorus calamus]